jgi:hypothetical protein
MPHASYFLLYIVKSTNATQSSVSDLASLPWPVSSEAELAGGLAGAAAGGDGACGAKLVSQVVKGVTGAVAGSDATASNEDISILRVAGAVSFGEGVAGERSPVEYYNGASGAIVSGAGFFGYAKAVAVIKARYREQSANPEALVQDPGTFQSGVANCLRKRSVPGIRSAKTIDSASPQ